MAAPIVTEAGAAEGYRDPRYVQGLAEWGRPTELPSSGGWLLERAIPGTDLHDAKGPYPLFACHDWSALVADLDARERSLVSVVLVTDPFGDHDEALLRRTFGTLVRPYKRHHLVDLDGAAQQPWSRKLEQTTRRALRRLTIEVDHAPASRVDTWLDLYSGLVARHRIIGLRAFSRSSFTQLLSMPGVSLLLARHDGEVVAGQVYLRQGDVVHCHLGAATAAGYAMDGFPALDRVSVDVFRGTAAWLDLGGGTSLTDELDPLTRYKQRWATTTRWTWLCGRILDRERYAALCASTGTTGEAWFPAYRAVTIRPDQP